MHVVATAGHVDHGKSTLVAALTGTDPDRHAEEKRRGLTIDLGYAWTELDGEQVAFVDVPGHERFVPTMLAGVGPVPAVLLVVAADGGWMPQSAEHLDALDGLGVRHGLLVLTRCDLADPAAAEAEARTHLARTSLAGIPVARVSARTGDGLPGLRAALLRLVRALPAPATDDAVRLWVDRVFTMRGAGTVVTGTLPAGTVAVGDRLQLPGGRDVRVRGVQTLGRPVPRAAAVARVALNLRGVSTDAVARGDALTTPDSHVDTALVDVRLQRTDQTLVAEPTLHLGSAHVPVHVRPLGDGAVRLRLRTPLPLRIGDLGLLRDPGRRQVLTGFTVLDVDPPPLRRRGSAARRGRELRAAPVRPSAAAELQRRRVVRRGRLVAMGVPAADVEAVAADALAVGDWLVDAAHARGLADRLAAAVADHRRDHPLEPGVPVEAARHLLALPTTALVHALVTAPLQVSDGRILDGTGAHDGAGRLPALVAAALASLRADLLAAPYAAPEAHRLRELGLGRRELAAAVRAGELAQVANGVYLTPEAVAGAGEPLRALPQPFTLSQARQAWGTSRRVAVPLLEHLDRRGVTERQADDRRRLR